MKNEKQFKQLNRGESCIHLFSVDGNILIWKKYFSCYHRRPMHNRRSSLLFFEVCSTHWLQYLCREKQSAWKRVWTYWFLLIGWKRVVIFASHKCIMASFYYQVQNAVNGLYCQANFSNFLCIPKTNLNKEAFWQSIRVLVVKEGFHVIPEACVFLSGGGVGRCVSFLL